jgi:hypothetical protein
LNVPRFSSFCSSFFGIALTAFLSITAAAQGANSGTVLGQLATVFSGSQVVQQVQLSANATWYAGSLEDTGTVTLTASSGGSSQMQLLLATSGQRTETQTGAGSSASCQWAGNDGVAHDVDLGNCWKPALWFLPSFSLQPSLLPSNLNVVDLGIGTFGSGDNTYRHLQCQLVLNSSSGSPLSSITQRSTTDIGLDPVSLLPAVLTYSIYPDNGATVPIVIEILYSNYRAVNGVQIPFDIQRYVNGSLQLEIQVSSAQIG